MKKYPPVVVVDENDNEIGAAMLADVWRQGLFHRIVTVFVLDDLGRMLLQLRGPNVGIHPNCWDQAAGGHVDEGHSYDQAAQLEVAEELGLHNITLSQIDTLRTSKLLDDGRRVNRFERIYEARIPHDTAVEPELEEVAKLQWFTPAEIKAAISQNREQFTDGLLAVLKKHFPAFYI